MMIIIIVVASQVLHTDKWIWLTRVKYKVGEVEVLAAQL